MTGRWRHLRACGIHFVRGGRFATPAPAVSGPTIPSRCRACKSSPSRPLRAGHPLAEQDHSQGRLSGHGSSSGTRQAEDRSAPTYPSSATSSPTGSKRSSSRTSHPRRTRRMSCSPVCISIRTLAISGSTNSRSRTLGSGSTSSQAFVSAVLRGKTLPVRNPSGDAARSASAAGKSWPRGAVRMPVTRFALLLPVPSRMRSSLVIPWP